MISNNLLVDIGEDTSNHMTYSEGSGYTVPQCWASTAKASMDCSFTPSYAFLGNALADGYANTQTQSGEPGAPLAGFYAGTDASNTIRTESSVALRTAAIGFRNIAAGDFRLTYNSNYAGNAHPGTDGYPAGADLDGITQAQGTILNLRALSITTSGATLHFQAPDPGAACYIKIGTGANITAYKTTPADTTANRLRSMAVTGLGAVTEYTAVAMCSGASNTPSVTFWTK